MLCTTYATRAQSRSSYTMSLPWYIKANVYFDEIILAVSSGSRSGEHVKKYVAVCHILRPRSFLL
jgi:hypothetical protein